jgi:hypothetical protein
LDELLADYDLRKGRLWPLVLAWIVLGPAVVRARRAVVRVECLSERSD